jgi:hypothetical protein
MRWQRGCLFRQQALELLRRGWPPGDEPRYDPDGALLACRLAGFRPGLTLLYERLRLFREVLQVRAARCSLPSPLQSLAVASPAQHDGLGGCCCLTSLAQWA